jgi:hypothetical protein
MPQTVRPLRLVNSRNLYPPNVTPDFTPMKNNSYIYNKMKDSDLNGTKQSLTLILISSQDQFRFLSVHAKYFNSATFRKALLSDFVRAFSLILVIRYEHIIGQFVSVLN